jgi:hypothetical protein
MKYIKLFEKYDYGLRDVAEKFTSTLITFSNAYFKDPNGWVESFIYPVASWIMPDKCEIAFYSDGEVKFACYLILQDNLIYLYWSTERFNKDHPIFRKYLQFGKYVLGIIKILSNQHKNADFDLQAKKYLPLSEDNIEELVKKFTMEEFELESDMGRYNL